MTWSLRELSFMLRVGQETTRERESEYLTTDFLYKSTIPAQY